MISSGLGMAMDVAPSGLGFLADRLPRAYATGLRFWRPFGPAVVPGMKLIITDDEGGLTLASPLRGKTRVWRSHRHQTILCLLRKFHLSSQCRRGSGRTSCTPRLR